MTTPYYKLVTLPLGLRLITRSEFNRTKNQATQKQKIMKTTFYIIAMFFGFQSNLLFANGIAAQSIFSDQLSYAIYEEVNSVTEVPLISAEELKELAPVNPKEADFSDNDLVSTTALSAATLAPALPSEADFTDSDVSILDLMVPDLAPKTPGEADFIDSDTNTVDPFNLAPHAPGEATFDDLT